MYVYIYVYSADASSNKFLHIACAIRVWVEMCLITQLYTTLFFLQNV